MDKEQILQASRQENQNKDLFELEIAQKAQRVAGLIGICVAFGLMVLERAVLDLHTNYGYFLIILAASTGLWLYKSVKLKRRHEILLAALWSLAIVYAAVMYCLNTIG